MKSVGWNDAWFPVVVVVKGCWLLGFVTGSWNWQRHLQVVAELSGFEARRQNKIKITSRKMMSNGKLYLQEKQQVAFETKHAIKMKLIAFFMISI